MNATDYLRRSILLALLTLIVGCERVQPDVPPSMVLTALDEMQVAIEEEAAKHEELDLPTATQVADARQEVVDRIPSLKRAALRLAKGDESEQAINDFNKLRRELRKKQDVYEDVQLTHSRAHIVELRRQQADRLAERQAQGLELGVTLDAYRRIEPGMNIGDVDLIVGKMGIEQSRYESHATYVWSEGFACIVCTTNGYKVVSKSQSGCE